MSHFNQDVVWIPYDKNGNVNEALLKEQVDIYRKNGWTVNYPQSFPISLKAGGELETVKSTGLAVYHGSPGCITFNLMGVLVTFCWPQS